MRDAIGITFLGLAFIGQSFVAWQHESRLNQHEARLTTLELSQPKPPECGPELSIGEYFECMEGTK